MCEKIPGGNVLFSNHSPRKESERQGLTEKLRYISYPKTTHEVKTVDFNGPNADVQLLPNFPIRVALGYKPYNFFLASSE